MPLFHFKPKGFSINFDTFSPIVIDEKISYKYFSKPHEYNPFPEIKTHKFNPVHYDHISKSVNLDKNFGKDELCKIIK